MNFLKRLPWLTILLVVILVLKFSPKIMEFLQAKAPSLANAVKPQTTTIENPIE